MEDALAEDCVSVAPLVLAKVEASRDMAASGSYHTDTFAAAREHRSRGIGSILLEFAFQRAIEQSIHFTSLSVFEGNSRAIKLCQRLGFQKLVRRPTCPHSWLNHTGDIVMMDRKDGNSA